MKFEKMAAATVRVGDASAMRMAIEWLDDAGIEVRRPANNNYQLKLAPTINYYPTKQTLMVDGGSSSQPGVTLEKLVDFLFDEGVIAQKPTRAADGKKGHSSLSGGEEGPF